MNLNLNLKPTKFLLLNFLVRFLTTLSIFISTSSFANTFSFGVFGDNLYSEKELKIYDKVIEDMNLKAKNNSNFAFNIHLGDLKGGGEPCSDTLLASRKNLLNRSYAPLVFLFGDNEWTDCHRKAAGGYDPQERLARLREIFNPDNMSLGQNKIKLKRQSSNYRYAPYSENVFWTKNNVVFAGFNLPGSNNNYLDDAINTEFEDRMVANNHWLKNTFLKATEMKSPLVVLAVQANPDFEFQFKKMYGIKRDGYLEVKQTLRTLVKDFKGQVLFLHGDSHTHQINQPFMAYNSKTQENEVLKNFTRVEGYGSPQTNHWLEIQINTTGILNTKNSLFKVIDHTVPINN